MSNYKSKKKKTNPYKQRKVKNALKHQCLPKYMWTRANLTKEIKRINPNIDCSALPLQILKELFLNYKEEYRRDDYHSIYFFDLNREYIQTLTQDDINNLMQYSDHK